MSFFDKLFGRPKNPEHRGQIHPQIRPANSLKILLEFYGCIAMERQLILKQLIVKQPWSLDLDMCAIRFEPDVLLDARILGTYSTEQQTWVWSWANAVSNFTDRAITHAQQLRHYGMENGIDAFTMDSLPANLLMLQKFGLIATILCRTSGYLFVPYNNGQILLTLHSPILNITPPDDDEHLNFVISQFTSKFDVHGKTAIANYLSLKDFKVAILDNDLVAAKNDKNILVEFDKAGKLVRFNGVPPVFGN